MDVLKLRKLGAVKDSSPFTVTVRMLSPPFMFTLGFISVEDGDSVLKPEYFERPALAVTHNLYETVKWEVHVNIPHNYLHKTRQHLKFMANTICIVVS
jgi:hypothetical protein